MQPDGPVQQPHGIIIFIPPVRDYELGLLNYTVYHWAYIEQRGQRQQICQPSMKSKSMDNNLDTSDYF